MHDPRPERILRTAVILGALTVLLLPAARGSSDWFGFLPLVSGRAEGSGLGLALAQQVAREHRGSLAYRSRAGHTVFTLLLPLQVEGTEHA